MNRISDQMMDELKTYPLPLRLKMLRVLSGCTQKDFADLIGSSQAAVSLWEIGTAHPCAKNLLEIIRIFQLPNSFFYDVFCNTEKVKK